MSTPQTRLKNAATRLVTRFGDDGALVLEFKIQTFSGDTQLPNVTTYGTGIFKGTDPTRRDDAEDPHVFFDVAADETDAAGVLTGSPLVLNAGDSIVWRADGALAPIEIPIVKTGVLATTDPADPIAYLGLEAMTKVNV